MSLFAKKVIHWIEIGRLNEEIKIHIFLMPFTIQLLFPQVIFLSLPLVMCGLFSQALEEVNSPNIIFNFFALHSVIY